MKKYFIFIFVALSIISPFPIFASDAENSGFIPGQIWYSKDVLVEGDTVNIHTAVWNGGKSSISVKVEFYDKNVILGSRDITLTPSELKDVFVPWKVTVGDHVISAKIISSQQTVSGVKEKIILSRNSTSNDKQFVPVVIKNEKGEPIKETNKIQTQLENTGAKITEILPESVNDSISNSFTVVEGFREKSSVDLAQIRDDTKKELEIIKNTEEKPILDKMTEKTNIVDATKEPVTYIKLFLFTILTLIFTNKILFYGLLILIIFLVLRFIYRRIRNR